LNHFKTDAVQLELILRNSEDTACKKNEYQLRVHIKRIDFISN